MPGWSAATRIGADVAAPRQRPNSEIFRRGHRPMLSRSCLCLAQSDFGFGLSGDADREGARSAWFESLTRSIAQCAIQLYSGSVGFLCMTGLNTKYDREL
jgi:hypothetical protein